ncbi:MAG: nicotinamide riboside transporter PnuC [Cyclobacteriaceae bacterium]|nr:nicotinamide riboside transporter PnuC [Cyclobacteriaceae bacterium]
MYLQEFWELFLQGARNSSALEAGGIVFGLASVWYAKKENILVFPTGIVSVLIYIYICAQFKLYADMSINGYYLVMSIYGWVVWGRTDMEKQHIPITACNTREKALYILSAVVAFFIIRFVLMGYTDSDVPNWDALTTAIFVVGMVLMARKKIENWVAWIVGDAISIPLYLYKGLAFTSFQFLVFTLMAVWGYMTWRRKLEMQER